MRTACGLVVIAPLTCLHALQTPGALHRVPLRRGPLRRVASAPAEEEAPGVVSAMKQFVDEGECEDEICILPPTDDAVAASGAEIRDESRAFDIALACLPVAAPALAFFSYTEVASFARHAFDYLKFNNYESVDGGAYEITILTPTIIGIVVPSLSITYATLTAMTVNTLRQRQLEARIALNRELGDLQLLRVQIEAAFLANSRGAPPPAPAFDLKRSAEA